LVHDLRNPLAAIFGGAEMLVDSALSPAQVKRLAGNIYKSSRRIQDMLQELLELGREAAASREVCRLADLVRAGLDSHVAAMSRQGVTVETQIPEDLEVEAARSRMERVFENLIANAVEAMPAGGAIRIWAQAGGGWVEAAVEDNGPGIAPEIVERLFHPFVTARKRNGMGLGLAFARQTVLDHGGDLWLDAGFRGGARFCLRLPRAGAN